MNMINIGVAVILGYDIALLVNCFTALKKIVVSFQGSHDQETWGHKIWEHFLPGEILLASQYDLFIS